MNKITLAIDPGASGGFAVRYPDGKIELMAMPEHDVDRIDFIKTLKARSLLEPSPIEAVMEKIMGRVGTKEAIIPEDAGVLRTTAQWRRPLSLVEINRMAPTAEVRARAGRP